jgi:hypothetical protein
MNTPCNLPYFEVPVDMAGNFVNDSRPVAQTSDVLVMSHGWNNTMSDARSLYERFFTQLCQAKGFDAKRFSVIGILWPSEKFAAADEIPGGAAALNNPGAFADGLLAQLPKGDADEEGMQELFEMPGDELLDLLAQSPAAPRPDGDDGEGGAQGIFSGIKQAALDLANVTTYYKMKARAGIVGNGAVYEMLNGIQTASPEVRIHLIGHSFGCRVVTSAAAKVAKPVASMTLLQAAFSHNSFSPDYDSKHKPGFFRDVIVGKKVSGPILISHTVKDLAVGLAYAVASRIARQNASAVGDANDPYGGLGRNGAQKTPEAVDGLLEGITAAYSFGPGIFNLKADSIIMAHGDIVKPEIANALVQATR